MNEREHPVQNAIREMNLLGKHQIPFLFIIDFEMEAPVIKTLPVDDPEILFSINGYKEPGRPIKVPVQNKLDAVLPNWEKYKYAFQKVKKHIYKGDSYLVNLTQPSKVFSDLSLLQLFYLAKAPYKLYYKDRFVVFSPETFVKIENGKMSSFPMKGTMDASLPDAENRLRSNPKEKAEHLTMVDLIRNDLSRVAGEVHVKRLCYLDLIRTSKGSLWQMSSEITGTLPDNYSEQIGNILFSLLPAGSISGAPKEKTVAIIKEAENYKRGYYTGIFGYFDGQKMDSAVMIRFIEKAGDQLIYKSGGGITAQSDLKLEYNELIQKIYVPVG